MRIALKRNSVVEPCKGSIFVKLRAGRRVSRLHEGSADLHEEEGKYCFVPTIFTFSAKEDKNPCVVSTYSLENYLSQNVTHQTSVESIGFTGLRWLEHDLHRGKKQRPHQG